MVRKAIGKMTVREFEAAVDEYFAVRENGASLADMCAWLGASVEEWERVKSSARLRSAAAKAMTRILASVENDGKRPATVTTLLLKQYAEKGNEGLRVEFVLREGGA